MDSAIYEGQPVYIVELGSGPGRFGYYLIRQLESALQSPDLAGISFTYVMTDVVEENLTVLLHRPRLQPYFERGRLDVAYFDAENPAPLSLRRSGTVLSPGTAHRPVVCIANYVFDSLRQDIYAVQNGQFAETLITISSGQPEPDLNDEELMSRLKLQFEQRPGSTEQYQDPQFNAILESYQQELPNVGFLFPVAVLECVRFLSRLSANGLLLLAADKGYDRVDGLMRQGGPGLALHQGAFSLAVNFDAIGRWVMAENGQFLRVSPRGATLTVVGAVLGPSAGQTWHLSRDLAETIGEFGPGDLFALAEALAENNAISSLQTGTALLRLSHWDPTLLVVLTPQLLALVPAASMEQKQDARDVFLRIWEEYFPIGERPDCAEAIGRLLSAMQFYSDALTFFQRSLPLSGDRPEVYTEMGGCFYSLQQWDMARKCACIALEMNPAYADGRSLLLRLGADASREGVMQRGEGRDEGT